MSRKRQIAMMVADDIAKELASSIDFEVLAGMLVELGWVRVDLTYTPPERAWYKIKDWVDQNCQGHHEEHMGTWVFEKQQDANWFVLKWGNQCT